MIGGRSSDGAGICEPGQVIVSRRFAGTVERRRSRCIGLRRCWVRFHGGNGCYDGYSARLGTWCSCPCRRSLCGISVYRQLVWRLIDVRLLRVAANYKAANNKLVLFVLLLLMGGLFVMLLGQVRFWESLPPHQWSSPVGAHHPLAVGQRKGLMRWPLIVLRPVDSSLRRTRTPRPLRPALDGSVPHPRRG